MQPSQEETVFTIPAAVPLAAGHDVECMLFATGKGGVFSTLAHYVTVIDHTTGIEYTPRSDQSAASTAAVAEPPWKTPEARLEQRVRGRVVRCVVEGWGPHESSEPRTFVWIAVGAPSAYR